MKLYTFLNEENKVIEEVRAETHDEALARCQIREITSNTDFYSTQLEDLQ